MAKKIVKRGLKLIFKAILVFKLCVVKKHFLKTKLKFLYFHDIENSIL